MIVRRVVTQRKCVALTFDDGPSRFTGQILSLLQEVGGKATFFCVGKRLGRHLDLIKKLHESGQELANHSYSHRRLDSPLTYEEIREEVNKTDTILQRTTRQRKILFRSPYG